MRYIVTDAAALCAKPQPQQLAAVRNPASAAANSGDSATQSQIGSATGPLQADSTAVGISTVGERQGRRHAEAAKDLDRDRDRVEGQRLLLPGSFDTVVDTFGLCSHADPVAALQVPCARALLVIGASQATTWCRSHVRLGSLLAMLLATSLLATVMYGSRS